MTNRRRIKLTVNISAIAPGKVCIDRTVTIGFFRGQSTRLVDLFKTPQTIYEFRNKTFNTFELLHHYGYFYHFRPQSYLVDGRMYFGFLLLDCENDAIRHSRTSLIKSGKHHLAGNSLNELQ